ncbi:hypothetical protein ISP15_03175 [Dyella jejuensis]|uniref:Uncharacterized protein n=1 Tax=Dyella jejuensis TaxID=1432009 RepID=A0ABW8JDZ4_9GAMM
MPSHHLMRDYGSSAAACTTNFIGCDIRMSLTYAWLARSAWKFRCNSFGATGKP